MANEASRAEALEGLGVPEAMLEPGLAVMVATGAVAAVVNGGPAVICYATVRGRASEADTEQFVGGSWWWLDVDMGARAVLPQMYRADQILGVPAIDLRPAEELGGEDAAMASPAHLTVTETERGFSHLPPFPSTYGAEQVRRITEDEQRSRIRIAELGLEIVRAIGVVLDRHPDALTHEEICVALNNVMARQLMHLVAPAEDTA